jgi:outer membrane protein OmpA-like peptidoglycan-associated protein
LVGNAGLQGAALVGPTGEPGNTGSVGAQGGIGQTGVRGQQVAGLAGETGSTGVQGVRGETGSTGPTGVVGIVDRWSAYQQFNFSGRETRVPLAEMDTVNEIAAYLIRNPSLEIGIDGSMDSATSDRSDRRLSNNRAESVRDALQQAGVPKDKIQMGAFANPDVRHQGQIQVLIKTRA